RIPSELISVKKPASDISLCMVYAMRPHTHTGHLGIIAKIEGGKTI
ncbi:MAG: hypothetical protein ACI9FU_001670, partial [Granulosicoccus sp.]